MSRKRHHQRRALSRDLGIALRTPELVRVNTRVFDVTFDICHNYTAAHYRKAREGREGRGGTGC